MSGMEKVTLARTLNFRDVVILAFSTMIGWGWVSLSGTWVAQAGGVGAVIAFLIGTPLCIFVGLTYCELTAMLPYAGGELVFAYKAMGYDMSWLTGWMITFAYIGVAAWEGPALATAIDYLVAIPKAGYLWTVAGFDVYATWLIVPVVMGGALMLLNIRGTKISSVFQAIITVILALGGIMFAVIGVSKGNIAEYAKPLISSGKGIMAVVMAVPAMFVGFDVVPQAAEEMNVPLKSIPKAIIISICMAAGWYIIVVMAAFFSAPQSVLSKEGLSAVNAISFAAGNPLFGKLLVVAGIMGILSSWNGFIIGATRVMYSMGRAKMLPDVFSKLHSKHKTPVLAIVLVGVITMVSSLLGRNSLAWFVDACAFGTVVAYLLVSISFVVLRIKSPELERPYKAKNGMLVGIIAIAISLFFITLYMPIGSSSLEKVEWIMVLGWVCLGIVLYLINLPKRNKYSAERESLLFGEETPGEGST